MDDPLTQGATMYNHYLFLALDTARQRTAEADRHRLAAAARAGDRDAARGFARRLIAGIALAVARLADESKVSRTPSAEATRFRLRSES
jgi:hypothetical protein